MLETVNAALARTGAIENEDLFNLSDRLSILRELKDQIENSLDLAKEQIEQVQQAMIAIMTNEEIPNFSRNGKTFSLTTKPYASVKPDGKEDFISWLDEHGFGDLAPRSINSQTLSSWVKEQTQDQELPEEIKPLISVFEKTSVSVRKGKVSK